MNTYILVNKFKSNLLVLLFFCFILLLGAILGKYAGFGNNILILAFILAAGISLFSYYKGAKIALLTSGAKPLSAEDSPKVHQMIKELCQKANLPLPKIYIIEDTAPNAFATGRNPQHAYIAFTRGIINSLSSQELAGVAAHELSHIKNYDILLMTLIICLVGVVSILVNMFYHRLFWGRSNNNQNNNPILLIISLLLAMFSPFIAYLIKMAISRKREFLADASAAQITQNPLALASALNKISTNTTPMKTANTATSHLYISNPFGHSRQFSLQKLFSTHPPINERIKQLEKINNHK